VSVFFEKNKKYYNNDIKKQFTSTGSATYEIYSSPIQKRWLAVCLALGRFDCPRSSPRIAGRHQKRHEPDKGR
jgi:hypothetical protein